MARRITRLVWSKEVEDKLAKKHNVEPREVREAVFKPEKLRYVREELHHILSRTAEGRYLYVILAPRGKGEAKVVTARPMTDGEKSHYKEMI